MSDGTFCRICHRLMVPSREHICVECKDAMKRAGYVKVVRCKDCRYNTGTKDKPYCVAMSVEPDWFCADGKGKDE